MPNTSWYANATNTASPGRTQSPGLVVQPFVFNVVNTNSATFPSGIGDAIILSPLPKFATLLYFVIDLPVLAGATNTNIGLGSAPTKFFATTNCNTACRISSGDGAGSAAALTGFCTTNTVPYQNLNTSQGGKTVDDDIRITFNNAITSPVNGTIRGYVMYTMDESYRETPNP